MIIYVKQFEKIKFIYRIFNILKKEFIAQRALSLFRGYYVAGLPEDAKTMYKVAIKTDCKSIFKWSYTRKAIKLFLK